MITVYIKTESHYTVNRIRIRRSIEQILQIRGVKGNIEISVSIVGDRMMRRLNRTYRNLDKTTDVLAFCLTEEVDKRPFVDPPDNILRLGDIVISYPFMRDEALEENKLVDVKMDELIEHGLLHLLGQHHD